MTSTGPTWREQRERGVRLPFGHSALVVVDFCLAYTDPTGPSHGPTYDAVADRCARVIASARRRGVRVVHTQVALADDGSDGGVFWRKAPALRALTRGNPLAEPDPRVAPVAGELVVHKQYASAFFGTSLASTLHTLGIDTVAITGVSTSGCVRATALDACQSGFVPYVVADAVGDRTATSHDATLFDIQAKYGEVVDADELERLWDVAS